MFSVYNKRERSLGGMVEGGGYAQLAFGFRDYLKYFKGAKLGVMLCIALHCDENNWSCPSIKTICDETDYNNETVVTALRDLRALTIQGHHVLARENRHQGTQYKSNGYLVFPSVEEWEALECRESPETIRSARKAEGPKNVVQTSLFPCMDFPCTGNPTTKKNQAKEKPDNTITRLTPKRRGKSNPGETRMANELLRLTGNEELAPPVTKKPHGLPWDFHLNEEMRQWGQENCPECDPEIVTQKFTHYYRNNPRKFGDWFVKWQEWVIRERGNLPRQPIRRTYGEQVASARNITDKIASMGIYDETGDEYIYEETDL